VAEEEACAFNLTFIAVSFVQLGFYSYTIAPKLKKKLELLL